MGKTARAACWCCATCTTYSESDTMPYSIYTSLSLSLSFSHTHTHTHTPLSRSLIMWSMSKSLYFCTWFWALTCQSSELVRSSITISFCHYPPLNTHVIGCFSPTIHVSIFNLHWTNLKDFFLSCSFIDVFHLFPKVRSHKVTNRVHAFYLYILHISSI